MSLRFYFIYFLFFYSKTIWKLSSSLDPYYESSTHRWHENNNLQFETLSSTGFPGTVAIRLSSISFENSGTANIALSDKNGASYYSTEVGFSYVNLNKLWERGSSSNSTIHVDVLDYNSQPEFDQQGLLIDDMKMSKKVRHHFSFIR